MDQIPRLKLGCRAIHKMVPSKTTERLNPASLMRDMIAASKKSANANATSGRYAPAS
jgi:hypothetical protein